MFHHHTIGCITFAIKLFYHVCLCVCVCACVACSLYEHVLYWQHCYHASREQNKTKAQQMDVKAIPFNPKAYIHTHTHVYIPRTKVNQQSSTTENENKRRKNLKQQQQNDICINSMKYKYTQISFTGLVQRQWFLCKWMLVDWFSLSRTLLLFRPSSLCNSCAYGTRAAFHSMLFIFAPVKSFAFSFLHFIFKLFYVVGGFSVFRYGANNINVCVCVYICLFGLGVFRRIFICASHRMVRVWCVCMCCLFLFFNHRPHDSIYS